MQAPSSLLPRTIGDVAFNNALRFGSKIAFEDDYRAQSFEGLAERVLALAAGLQSLGLKPGDRIAFLCRNRIECLELFLVASFGFIIVPVNWRLSPSEVSYILQDCQPSVIFAEEDFARSNYTVLEQIPAIRHRFLIGRGSDAEWRPYEEFLQSQHTPIDMGKQLATDAACIVYTSGTTGRPKGAVLSHRALLASCDQIANEMLGLNDTDITLCVMPLFHVGGMWFHCFPSFASGATTILQSIFVPSAVLQAMIERSVTNVHLVPTMVSELLGKPETNKAARYLKKIFYAASPMPVATLKKAMQQFPETQFYQSYGSTEAGPICWLSPDNHTRAIQSEPELLSSCGRTFERVSTKVVGPSGGLVEQGEVGEVLVQSDATMSEYWCNESATSETILNGWVATGDLARKDQADYMYIADRKNNMIISGGENIYPIEVENVLLDRYEIVEASVIGVPDDRWVERVVACIVLEDGTDLSENEIIAHTKQHLSGYKCPKEVCFLSALPKNAAGKILKRTLRDDYPFR